MQLLDGTIFGRKCDVFDYSNKRSVSVLEWKRRKETEFKRICQSSKNSCWATDHRPAKSVDNSICEEDKLNQVKSIGKTSIKKYKTIDVLLVKHLAGLGDEQKSCLISGGINVKSLDTDINCARSAASGEYPYPPTDHCHSENPYQSCFSDDYKIKVKNCTALKPFVPITDLVRFHRKTAR